MLPPSFLGIQQARVTAKEELLGVTLEWNSVEFTGAVILKGPEDTFLPEPPIMWSKYTVHMYEILKKNECFCIGFTYWIFHHDQFVHTVLCLSLLLICSTPVKLC